MWLIGELIVYPCSDIRPSYVRRTSSTFSNMNISATSGLIAMKFYQRHHWDRRKAALGFGPDGIKTLFSMVTYSSHRVIMEKMVLLLFQAVFIQSFLYLQEMMTCMGAQTSSKFWQIRPPPADLAGLERLKKTHRLIMGETVLPPFLGCS